MAWPPASSHHRIPSAGRQAAKPVGGVGRRRCCCRRRVTGLLSRGGGSPASEGVVPALVLRAGDGMRRDPWALILGPSGPLPAAPAGLGRPLGTHARAPEEVLGARRRACQGPSSGARRRRSAARPAVTERRPASSAMSGWQAASPWPRGPRSAGSCPARALKTRLACLDRVRRRFGLGSAHSIRARRALNCCLSPPPVASAGTFAASRRGTSSSWQLEPALRVPIPSAPSSTGTRD